MPMARSLRTVGAPVHVFFRSRRVKSELRLRKSMKNEGHGGPHRIFCGHFQAYSQTTCTGEYCCQIITTTAVTLRTTNLQKSKGDDRPFRLQILLRNPMSSFRVTTILRFRVVYLIHIFTVFTGN